MQALVKQNPAYIHGVGSHNRSLLWDAARHNRPELLKYLVEQGADVNHAGENPPLQPYAVARSRGYDEIAEYLREHGAEIDFYSAIYLGLTEEIRSALEADPASANRCHPQRLWSCAHPLQYALLGEQLEVVNLLFAYGASLEEHGQELLHNAADTNNIDVVHKFWTKGQVLRGC